MRMTLEIRKRPMTIEDVIRFLMPSALEGRNPIWPPDAFAVAAYILKQSGAYTDIVNNWPPPPSKTTEHWHGRIRDIAGEWRRSHSRRAQSWPRQVDAWWKLVMRKRALNLDEIQDERPLVRALAGIVAAADQTCAGIGILPIDRSNHIVLDAQMYLSEDVSTLCKEIHPSRVSVLPKLHNSLYGMTLRSLTHNLALWDEPEVVPHWENVKLRDMNDGMNVLLVPWPFTMNRNVFRVLDDTCGEKMPQGYGFFTYDPGSNRIEPSYLQQLIEQAEKLVGTVDAVVLPELSVDFRNFQDLRDVLKETLLIAGIGMPVQNNELGVNAVAIGWGVSKIPVLQTKHHRWKLDSSQVGQYGLAFSGDKEHLWEAIEMGARECTFFNANPWLTFCVLICEDLARQDPVAELVRTVGPNLVIALLMDGPQIPERWSARYATVLADDPRSSVLTLTCAGMVDLACSQSGRGPRSIGLWKDAQSGEARRLVLEPGAEAIVLALKSKMKNEWTADGRNDDEGTGYLNLTGIYQITPPRDSGNRPAAVVSKKKAKRGTRRGAKQKN